MRERSVAVAEAVHRQREGFPGLRDCRYFNYGAQGPLPTAAFIAIRDAFAQVDRLGTFSTETYAWSLDVQRQARTVFASALGTSPDRVALVENINAAAAAVLWGLEWRPGDHIVVTDGEYPGIRALVQEVARRWQLRVTVAAIAHLTDGGDAVAGIASEVGADTRLVVASHVLWTSGLRVPLEALVRACRRHAHAPLVLVDGAQAVGMVPVDVAAADVDFYCCTASKWLCGPQGVAALYLAPSANDCLAAALAGWRGVLARTRVGAPPLPAARLEGGTPCFPLLSGVKAAASVHRQWGDVATIHARVRTLAQHLWSELARNPLVLVRPTPPDTGIVPFKLSSGSHAAAALSLETAGCLIKALPEPEALRACVHYLTTEDEIDALVWRVRTLLR